MRHISINQSLAFAFLPTFVCVCRPFEFHNFILFAFIHSVVESVSVRREPFSKIRLRHVELILMNSLLIIMAWMRAMKSGTR